MARKRTTAIPPITKEQFLKALDACMDYAQNEAENRFGEGEGCAAGYDILRFAAQAMEAEIKRTGKLPECARWFAQDAEAHHEFMDWIGDGSDTDDGYEDADYEKDDE